MSEASQLSPELARGLLQLARALVAAARNWTLYPAEHPAVSASVSRLSDALQRSTLGAIFSIGVTPHTLLVEGMQVPLMPLKEQTFDRHIALDVQVAPSGSFDLQVGMAGVVVMSQ